MKKIFAIVLVVVMMMSMGSTAFAAEYIGDETKDYSDSTSIDVYAKYSADASGVGVISVDIEYEAMQFVYVNSASSEWDPDTHTYTGAAVQQGWVAVGGETEAGHVITVTNHSNVPVWVDVDAEVDTDTYTTITDMTFWNYDQAATAAWAIEELAAGVVDKYDEADNVRILTNLVGTLDNSTPDYVDVADIIVTIYGDNPAGSTTNPANP